MAITIRTARADDVSIIVEYNRLMAEETEDKVLDLAVLTAGVTAAVADPNKIVYYLAEEDGAVVGQLGITNEWSDWRNGWQWWIQSVYVAPAARKKGVFRALYHYVHEAAKRDGSVIGIYLYVERENHAAQKTYLSMGMEWTDYLILQRFPL
jgi:GNAT superfamily N-acetyltransferase